jgi:hypothetical protein
MVKLYVLEDPGVVVFGSYMYDLASGLAWQESGETDGYECQEIKLKHFGFRTDRNAFRPVSTAS